MKSFGNINFQQNLAQQLAFEVESGFPEVPVVGRILFTNQRLYICVDLNSGTPIWIPLTNVVNTFTFQQASPATSWVITHNLATSTPMVQVYTQTSPPKMIIPDAVTPTDSNHVTVSFGAAQAGYAVVMYGDIDGAPQAQYAFTFTQTSLSDTWTINHNLGYNPVVRVFIGTEEVQPATVTFPDLNNVIVTFAMAQVGTARLM